MEPIACGVLDARRSLSSGRASRGPVGGHDGGDSISTHHALVAAAENRPRNQTRVYPSWSLSISRSAIYSRLGCGENVVAIFLPPHVLSPPPCTRPSRTCRPDRNRRPGPPAASPVRRAHDRDDPRRDVSAGSRGGRRWNCPTRRVRSARRRRTPHSGGRDARGRCGRAAAGLPDAARSRACAGRAGSGPTLPIRSDVTPSPCLSA